MRSFNQLKDRFTAELARLDEIGRKRALVTPIPQVGMPQIDLSHNDYLGLRTDRVFQKNAHEAGSKSLVGGGASRLLGGQFPEFEELESAFASYKGAESALYFPSGYSANEAVVTCLAHRKSEIFSDQFNHASIIDGVRLSPLPKTKTHIFKHASESDLEDALQKSDAESNIILTESLFSMDGDFAPLVEYYSLAEKYNGILVVDEAHATGLYGKNGNGLISELGLDHKHIISVNTCGKALGTQGALVCGPQWFKDYLINKARSFIYTTAPSPKMAAAVLEAINHVSTLDERRERLKYLSSTLLSELKELGYDTLNSNSHIIPVIMGTDQKAVEATIHLNKSNVKTFPIRPPTVPEGTARLRLSLHASLSEVDLAYIIEAFSDFRNQ
jgi:8-amino-7-oxononanoate synthase